MTQWEIEKLENPHYYTNMQYRDVMHLPGARPRGCTVIGGRSQTQDGGVGGPFQTGRVMSLPALVRDHLLQCQGPETGVSAGP